MLMIFSLTESQKQMSRLFSVWQTGVYEKSLDTVFEKMLPRSLLISFFEASPKRTLQTGLALYNLRILGKRPSVLLMGLCNLSAWWILLLGFLFMNVSGLMLVGISSLSLVSFLNFPRLRASLRLLLWTGLFLVGAELMLRNSAILQSVLGESSLAFWLADGRWAAVFALFLFTAVLGLFIQAEFWSLCLALVLLLTSTVSFNGALALLAGERCARGILFWWSGRRLNKDCRQISSKIGFSLALGAAVGLVVALLVKILFNFGGSFGMESAQERLFQMMIGFVVILFMQFVVQMTIGHFVAQGEVDELQEALYFPPHWLRSDRLSKGAMRWSRSMVAKRIQEIRYHLQGLATYKQGQIPDHLQARLKNEEEELLRLQAYLGE